jgi:hypothetical protein
MQQSLFAGNGATAPDTLSAWRQAEARWRAATLAALGLAGMALIAALAAVALVFLR